MGKHYDYDIVVESFNIAVRTKNYFRQFYENKYDRGNIDQLIRSSSSVSANIEEAQNSSSKKELSKYYRIALKSARESIHWLKFMLETLPSVSKTEVNKLTEDFQKLVRIVAACVIKLGPEK